MDKSTAAQKVQEKLGIEPREANGLAIFELNGVYLCHISGNEEYSSISFLHSGTNTDCFDFERLPGKLKKLLAIGYKAGSVNVPDGAVVLTDFDYKPGDKWECGILNLIADTPLGTFVWEEIIPGPRHGDDHAELTVRLNDVELDLWEHGLDLDFEPPNKEGRWAQEFAASKDQVEERLSAWFKTNARLLTALVDGLPLAPDR